MGRKSRSPSMTTPNTPQPAPQVRETGPVCPRTLADLPEPFRTELATWAARIDLRLAAEAAAASTTATTGDVPEPRQSGRAAS